MGYILVFLLLVVIGFVVFQFIKINKPDVMMKHAGNAAVSTAKQCYQIDLDYSESSVEKVEEVLGKVYEEYLSSKSEEGLHGLSIMYGAYLGEVFKRAKGVGFWGRDHEVFGKNSFPFYKNEKDCFFPVSWCFKRMTNGAEDNVVHKYKYLIEE